MKLRVKHITDEITVAEVIEQIFEETFAEDLSKVFYYDKETAMNNIDSSIKYVLGYDDNIDLNYIYEKSDLDEIRNKAYDIMRFIVNADKESE